MSAVETWKARQPLVCVFHSDTGCRWGFVGIEENGAHIARHAALLEFFSTAVNRKSALFEELLHSTPELPMQQDHYG